MNDKREGLLVVDDKVDICTYNDCGMHKNDCNLCIRDDEVYAFCDNAVWQRELQSSSSKAFNIKSYLRVTDPNVGKSIRESFKSA